MSYAIATFCYGERYYDQTNRMIESFKKIKDIPTGNRCWHFTFTPDDKEILLACGKSDAVMVIDAQATPKMAEQVFEEEMERNSMLGERFNYYESIFKVKYNKKDMWMPEDCIQFLDIEKEKFYSFLTTWDKCIEIKYSDNLRNTPAGNIDEMCFSAFHNEIELHNNSNKHINLLIPNHDKWY